MVRSAVIAALLLACLGATAQARPRHHQSIPPASCVETGTAMAPSCMGRSNNFLAGIRSIKVRMHKVSDTAGAIVAHPAGCPRVAFCACGAIDRLKRVWGVAFRQSRELWLASNWFRFPRAAPAPGMAAVKPHHVMVLEANLGGGVWQVYDANSGHHLTRVHARSIAGFTIVNPTRANS